jgi:hypothetical protein
MSEGSMALRMWLVIVALLAALAAGYAIPWNPSRPAGILRSEHSRPAVRVPSGLVAVTPEGKTFHVPTCGYIHGPAEMIPGEKAVAEGYTPCVRCMPEALGVVSGGEESRPR